MPRLQNVFDFDCKESDSDLFFVSEENTATLKLLHPNLSNVSYHEITSIHGHDAFLIEYEQLNSIIDKIFKLELV